MNLSINLADNQTTRNQYIMKKLFKSRIFQISALVLIVAGIALAYSFAGAEETTIDKSEVCIEKGEKADLAMKCGDDKEKKKCDSGDDKKKCGEGEDKKKCSEGEDEEKCGEGKCGEGKCGGGDDDSGDEEEE